MAQGVLPFKYETEKNTTGMTALAGLPVYLDLARVIGLSKSIEKHLKVRKGGQGWTDSQIVLSLVLLPTMDIKSRSYKVFGMVTNMDWEGERLIHWLHERCVKSEEAHAVMKDDLAGGKLPSDDFGENAAWWWIMILALNLNSMMKNLALGGAWYSKRMKAVRFSVINLPGRVVKRSRGLIIRLTRNHPSLGLLVEARKRIAMMKPAPCG